MKKTLFLAILLMVVTCSTGCEYLDDIDETIENSYGTNVTCSTEKQYLDDYGYSYYVEGKCVNDSSKDYDYLQVEYICYDSDGNNLGTAIDNTNNLLSGQTWKFKAITFAADDNKIDHCDYHDVTAW